MGGHGMASRGPAHDGHGAGDPAPFHPIPPPQVPARWVLLATLLGALVAWPFVSAALWRETPPSPWEGLGPTARIDERIASATTTAFPVEKPPGSVWVGFTSTGDGHPELSIDYDGFGVTVCVPHTCTLEAHEVIRTFYLGGQEFRVASYPTVKALVLEPVELPDDVAEFWATARFQPSRPDWLTDAIEPGAVIPE